MLLKYFVSLTIFRRKFESVLRCSFQLLCLFKFYQVKELISCKHSIWGLWETSKETSWEEFFSTETVVLKFIPSNSFLEIRRRFRTTSQKLFLDNCLSIQPIKITPRFCKLSSLVFFLSFVSYINRNHKYTTHP